MTKRLFSIALLVAFLLPMHIQGQTITSFPYTPCFYDSLAPGWSTIDADGDGHTWNHLIISGNVAPAFGCWISSASYRGGVGALTPDNWLVSPPIVVNDQLILSWQHRAQNANFFAEHYAVYVSTTGADTAAFLSSAPLYETTLTAADAADWVEHQVSLAAYLGDTVRLAFRHFGCHDMWHFYIDDITVMNPYSPVISMEGQSSAVTNVNYRYMVSLLRGSTTGLTYQWHSTLVPTATSTDTVFNITYSTEGIDTVSVVATNGYGSDTAWMVVTVDNSIAISNFPYLQDFEGGMAGWTTLDNDEYNYNWTISSNEINVNAHSGTHFIASKSYIPNSNIGAITPDNFLVSPPMRIMSDSLQLEWWQRGYNSSYYADHYAVYVSTTGPTVNDFLATMPLYEATITAAEAVTWTPKSVSLSAYNGQTVWVAFRHFNCYDQWAVYLDDIAVTGVQYDTIPPEILIMHPATAMAMQDTVYFSANLIAGDTAGLTYAWSHTLSCNIMNNGASQQVVYTAAGIDTATVIATNIHGSDTASCTINVTGNLQGSIAGLATVVTDDTLTYTATLEGLLDGVTYTWHSSKAAAGQADTMVNGNTLHIVYHTGGTDVITLVATNALGSASISRTITINSCSTISSFPHYEGFESSSCTDCWLSRLRQAGNYPTQHQWHRSNGRTGYFGMFSNGNSANGSFEAWLITPAVQLPADASGNAVQFFTKFHYGADFAVLVSPTGNSDYRYFTDTLYHVHFEAGMSNTWDSLVLPLTNYGGQRIRLAFLHYGLGSLNTVRLDDVSFLDGIAFQLWSLNANCDNTMGTVSGGGQYIDSSLVTLTATPNDGYHFTHWQDGNTTNPRQVLVVSDTTFTAYFAADSVPPTPPVPDTVWRTVTVGCDSTMGTVSGGGVYQDSSTVWLTATPLEGYEFDRWDDGDTVNPRQVFVISDTAFTALFRVAEDTVGIPRSTDGSPVLTIYPNPSRGEVTIVVIQPSTVSITDLVGREIVPPTVVNDRLSIEDLFAGIYLVRVSTDNASTVKKLLVE
ncbi:MAG: choice-of-anchor J domain-containing protein [Bacteroidales bacterium]|nr:choice-of-anchor J domain-containing protein [Bacteroidales bacterium]